MKRSSLDDCGSMRRGLSGGATERGMMSSSLTAVFERLRGKKDNKLPNRDINRLCLCLESLTESLRSWDTGRVFSFAVRLRNKNSGTSQTHITKNVDTSKKLGTSIFEAVGCRYRHLDSRALAA